VTNLQLAGDCILLVPSTPRSHGSFDTRHAVRTKVGTNPALRVVSLGAHSREVGYAISRDARSQDKWAR